jgi:hypothetical protein
MSYDHKYYLLVDVNRLNSMGSLVQQSARLPSADADDVMLQPVRHRELLAVIAEHRADPVSFAQRLVLLTALRLCVSLDLDLASFPFAIGHSLPQR